MKPLARGCVVPLLGLLAASPALAYFEQTDVGARGSALGLGAIALVQDASAFYWNPAALSKLSRAELIADYSKPYGVPDLSVGTVGVAARALGSGWAAAWHRLALSDAYSEDLFSLAAGREVFRRGGHAVAGGLTYKYLRIGFGDLSDPASGASFGIPAMAKGSLDAGVVWSTPWTFDLAWVGRDLNEPRFELVSGSGGDALGRRQELAAAVRWNRESTITLGWAQPENGSAAFNAGIEILFFEVFAIRSGVTNLSNVYRSLGSPNEMQFTGGFGVFHGGYSVDAAATTHHELGASYRASVRVQFGGSSNP